MSIDEPSLPPERPADSTQPPAQESAPFPTGPSQEASPQPAPPPPPPIVVQEVEAVPVSKSEPAQRTIDAPPIIEPVRSEAPPPPPPPIQPPPAASAAATSSMPPESSAPRSSIPSDSSAPPPSSIPPPPPITPPPAPPRESAWRRRKQFIWSILCHLLLILVIPTVFVGMAATFLIWQLKGKKDRLVEDQGREALNFQINVAALTALLGITCLGAPLIPMVWFVAVIMAIVAARHASDGETYRYPWVLRIVTH